MNVKTSDFGSLLIIMGALIAVLYIPNGVLHRFLGSGVYGRDVLLALHITAMGMYLIAIRQFRYFLRAAWPVLGVLALLLPLYNSRGNLKDLLITMKWGVQWLDWMAIGYLISLRAGRAPALAVFLAVCGFLVMLCDAGVGLYEERTNRFLFPAEEAETGAGVSATRNSTLAGSIRVQGLQRDVFTFANFTGIGFTLTLCMVALKRKASYTIVGLVVAGVFAWSGSNSGGRSVIFGMMLVAVLFLLVSFTPGLFRKHANKVLLTAVIGEAIMCLIGIGQTLLVLLNSVGWHASVFNLASSFERDEVWKERVNTLLDYPISLIFGMPSAFYVFRSGDPINFVDNLPLWIFYHFGTVGTVMFIIFFWRYSRVAAQKLHPGVWMAMIFFMGLVLGEGLARDSLSLYGALPMFGLIGFLAGKNAVEQRRIFVARHARPNVPTLVA